MADEKKVEKNGALAAADVITAQGNRIKALEKEVAGLQKDLAAKHQHTVGK